MSIDNKTLEEYRNIIENNVEINPELTIEYCEKIIALCKETGCKEYLAYAFYFCGEAFYTTNEIGDAMYCLAQAEGYSDESDDYELIAKIYNLCAIVYMTVGNSANAMDSYIKSLVCARQYRFEYHECVALINIGTLYYGYQEYGKASENFEKALTLLDKSIIIKNGDQLRVIVYQGLGKCALRQGNREKAIEYRAKLHAMDEKIGKNVGVMMFDAMVAEAVGETQERDVLITEIMSMTDESINIMDFFDDYYEYALFLLQVEKNDEFVKLVSLFDRMVDEAGVTFLSRKVAELFIKYYKTIGDETNYLKAAGIYYDKTARMEQSNRAMVINMMNTKVDLEAERQQRAKIQRENEKLTKTSETDALTGLNNRFKLNHTADDKFQKAAKNHSFFAIEILDIDYFKQFNDNYGHQEGDKCIKLIADELKKISENEGVTAYRYGGDEFVVIYEGLTETAVREIAESLKQGITDQHMEHAYSKAADYVTISQGICFEIPRAGENVWNYLHHADESLYEVKKYSRNSITVTRYKESK